MIPAAEPGSIASAEDNPTLSIELLEMIPRPQGEILTIAFSALFELRRKLPVIFLPEQLYVRDVLTTPQPSEYLLGGLEFLARIVIENFFELPASKPIRVHIYLDSSPKSLVILGSYHRRNDVVPQSREREQADHEYLV